MMKNARDIELTICIVSWNCIEVLRRCLESIIRYSEGLAIQIIVVDNASTDNTPDIIRCEFPHVELISNAVNNGFGRANNQAIQISRGRYLLLLNPDVVITRPCFRQMMTYLDAHSDVGCVGCKLVNTDGSVQKSFYENFPTPFSEFLEGIMFNKIYRRASQSASDSADVINTAWIVGACMMFKRDVLMRLGGFNEQYFMYGEDADLCFRLRKLGYQVHYLGYFEMFHYHAASSKKKARPYFSSVLQRESVYRFIKNHYGMLSALLYRVLWVVSSIVRLSLILPAVIVSFIFRTQYRGKLIQAFEKYSKIISWCLGFESWTRRQIPE